MNLSILSLLFHSIQFHSPYSAVQFISFHSPPFNFLHSFFLPFVSFHSISILFISFHIISFYTFHLLSDSFSFAIRCSSVFTFFANFYLSPSIIYCAFFSSCFMPIIFEIHIFSCFMIIRYSLSSYSFM
jgi:hypothetical protein